MFLNGLVTNDMKSLAESRWMPAVDPYGFDFVLYQSLTPTVLYGPGLSLTVTSDGTSTVPLPPGAVVGLVMGCWVVVNLFAQRHRRSV